MIDFFFKGGFLMYPILFCSVAGLALFVNKGIHFRRLIREIERPVDDLLDSRPALLEPLLKAIESHSDLQELSIVGTRQIREVEMGLSWLGLMATVAPLLGLTGTVTGMIKAFMVIAESNQVSPSMLASGIWEALITTGAGLFVAIPLHVGHHYLERRADDIAHSLKEITIAIYTRAKNGIC